MGSEVGQITSEKILFACLCLALASSGCNSASSKTVGGDRERISFHEATQEAGLDAIYHENGAAGRKYYPEMMGSGGALYDYDRDGWLDVVVMGGGRWAEDPDSEPQAIWLYHGKGDGTFEDVTAQAGLGDVDAYTIGQVWGDYDNDGDGDLFVTTLTRNLFFRNEGGRFVEVGKQVGLGDESVWSSSALFFDADRDGWLDLYVSNYADWTPDNDKWCPEGSSTKMYCVPAEYEGIASRFYHNNGDGTFTDRSWEDGFLPAIGKSLGVVEIDYNHDGWSDVVVSNDGEGDLLYENQGDGTFVERGVASGIAFSEHGEARSGMGIDAGVVDSTGEVTIFIGHFSEETSGVYQHLGNGLFRDRSTASRIGHPSMTKLTFGTFLFDVDLDGDLDLFAANGHVQPDRVGDEGHITFRQPAQLYLNEGNGTFAEFHSEEPILLGRLVARAAAFADYDRDGDVDVFLTENDGPVHLWRNDSKAGHFLRVRLEGRDSNRDAYGTLVEAFAGGSKMERRVRSGSSYLTQMEPAVTFGLGARTSVDSVRISWPSGRVDRFRSVSADREIQVIEGEGAYTEFPLPGRKGV